MREAIWVVERAEGVGRGAAGRGVLHAILYWLCSGGCAREL